MGIQPLFVDKKIQFEALLKTAGTTTKLSDNTDVWQQQISQEAYKRLPYLSSYEVSIIIDRLDEERSFAFGSIAVKPKSDMSYSENKENPLSVVHIPILIKDQMLYPFDIFVVNSKYYFLTEPKLNEALFRPEMFDASRERPPEYSLAMDLMPPSFSAGFGGTKIGMPILPLLDGRVTPRHKERFLQELSDPSVKVAYANAPEGIKAAVLSAAKLDVSDPTKTAEAAWSHVKPDVVQLKQLSNGNYLMKWANIDMFSPEEQMISPEMAMALAQNTGFSQQLSEGETVTANPEAIVAQSLLAEGVRIIDEFGLWSVQDKSGNMLTGWAFPNILNFDMSPGSLMLFTNGSVHSLQEQAVGKQVGKSTDIPKSVPKGYGSLYFSQGGKAQAFIPVTILNTFTGPDGRVRYVGERLTGEPISFTFSSDIKQLSRISEGDFLVPSNYYWLPLQNQIEIVSDPQMFVKTANKNHKGTLEIIGDADVFTLRGAPLAKVASEHKQFINRDQAEFMCVAMGMCPNFTKTALSKASRGELITVSGLKVIGNAGEKLASARNKIKTALSNLPYPIRNYNLVKEASVLRDALTADKILGLGFINVENVATFVDMLPKLEEASSNIAEMLMASRLGLDEIPESALERMLFALEDVITGLKKLKQQEMPFGV